MLNKRFIDFVNLIIRKSKKYLCHNILLFLFLFKIFHIKITLSDSSFFFCYGFNCGFNFLLG